jgi:hypothetical protein
VNTEAPRPFERGIRRDYVEDDFFEGVLNEFEEGLVRSI